MYIYTQRFEISSNLKVHETPTGHHRWKPFLVTRVKATAKRKQLTITATLNFHHYWLQRFLVSFFTLQKLRPFCSLNLQQQKRLFFLFVFLHFYCYKDARSIEFEAIGQPNSAVSLRIPAVPPPESSLRGQLPSAGGSGSGVRPLRRCAGREL